MIPPNELPSAFRGIRTFTATAVSVLEGGGTEADPCYEATYIYDEWGALLTTLAPSCVAGRVPRSRLEEVLS